MDWKIFGCEINLVKTELPIEDIKCFTTRPDTLFGFSFLALSVDHPISEFFKDDEDFIKFKQDCSKQELQKNQLLRLIKLVLKLISLL